MVRYSTVQLGRVQHRLAYVLQSVLCGPTICIFEPDADRSHIRRGNLRPIIATKKIHVDPHHISFRYERSASTLKVQEPLLWRSSTRPLIGFLYSSLSLFFHDWNVPTSTRVTPGTRHPNFGTSPSDRPLERNV